MPPFRLEIYRINCSIKKDFPLVCTGKIGVDITKVEVVWFIPLSQKEKEHLKSVL